MNSEELLQYINTRNGELNRDELLVVLDITENSQIDHINYENRLWNMWDNSGMNF